MTTATDTKRNDSLAALSFTYRGTDPKIHQAKAIDAIRKNIIDLANVLDRDALEALCDGLQMAYEGINDKQASLFAANGVNQCRTFARLSSESLDDMGNKMTALVHIVRGT